MNRNQTEIIEEIEPILIEYADIINNLTTLATSSYKIHNILGLILLLKRDILRTIEKIDTLS